jgi:transposase
MPKRYPPEFKRDVVMVARTSGLTHAQIAEDFGISEHSVQRWLKQADIDDGVVEGTTTTEQDELVALKRRNRVLEQEVEILRRATVNQTLGSPHTPLSGSRPRPSHDRPHQPVATRSEPPTCGAMPPTWHNRRGRMVRTGASSTGERNTSLIGG